MLINISLFIYFRPYICFFNNTFINDDKSEQTEPCVSCLTSFIRTVVSLVSTLGFTLSKIKYINFKKLYNLDGTKYQTFYS